MRLILQIVSWLSLAATIVPPALYMAGRITLDQSTLAMFLAAIGWFATAPFWMGRPKVQEELVI